VITNNGSVPNATALHCETATSTLNNLEIQIGIIRNLLAAAENDKAACEAGAQSVRGLSCTPVLGASQSPVDVEVHQYFNIFTNAGLALVNITASCGPALQQQLSVPGTEAVTGVQGYDPNKQGVAAYTNGTATVGTNLVIYGTFPASGNLVWIDGRAVTPSYQGASGNQQGISQINIPIGTLSPGAHSVAVGMGGAYGPEQAVPFTVAPLVTTGAPSAAVGDQGRPSAPAQGAGTTTGSSISSQVQALGSELNGVSTLCSQTTSVNINGVTAVNANPCAGLSATQQLYQQLLGNIQGDVRQLNSLQSPAANDTVNVGSESPSPITVTVNASVLNIRSAPRTTAPVVGTVREGTSFVAVNTIAGETVEGTNTWWVTSDNQYVWAGGTVVPKP
jgi:hypothetical protein